MSIDIFKFYFLLMMNKILIVDASESDRRLMAGLLVKSGYEPIAVETMEAAKDEVALSPWRSQRSVERNCHRAQSLLRTLHSVTALRKS
ncbi:MAG: hypothetical protein K2H33_00205 [Muribaculaceae bacterium]|nr:hypothetical protein [Muribaculaceae bacterium]